MLMWKDGKHQVSRITFQSSKLDKAYTYLLVEKEELQQTVKKFDQCCIEFENILKRNSLLEQELHETQNQLLCLESTKLDLTAAPNQSLFDEFKEIEEVGQLLSPEDLESAVAEIKETHDGICMPGDVDRLEEVKLDIDMQRERLSMLQKQEQTIQGLIDQNELTKEELDLQITKLNAAQHQCEEDEKSLTEQCLRLSEEVEVNTNGIIDVVAQTLRVYMSCEHDKDTANRFLAFGPLDVYRESQALFRTQFDLFVTKNLNTVQEGVSEEDLRDALSEAKVLEKRLYSSMSAYATSRAALAGDVATLSLVTEHRPAPTNETLVKRCMEETQAALVMLEQEEAACWATLQGEMTKACRRRVELLASTAARTALRTRQRISTDLTFLLTSVETALQNDLCLYAALRAELGRVLRVCELASQLQVHVAEHDNSTRSRMQSMSAICAEQAASQVSLESSDPLLNVLSNLFSTKLSGAPMLAKLYMDLQSEIAKVMDNVEDGFERKEKMIKALIARRSELSAPVLDGCVGEASGNALRYETTQAVLATEGKLTGAIARFTELKNGDKDCLRKLWQWFLTDEGKLAAVMKGLPCKSYNM